MSWQINATNGDYIMTNGAPVDDPNLIYPAYYRLKIRRQQWLYAPNSTYGSDFYKLQRNYTTKPNTSIETIGARALQPIVDDGRATSIAVTVTGVSRSGIQLQTNITSGNSQPSTLTLNGLGVV